MIVRWLVLAWLLVACAARRPTSIGDDRRNATHLRVRVVDATIASTRPDGSPWNTHKPSKTWTVIGTVAGLLTGDTATGAKLGSSMDGDERDFPPAPLVEINVGGKRYATTALSPTFSATWDEDLLIDTRGAKADDVVVITLRDGVDGKVIGTTKRSLGELEARASRTLADIPNVPSLNLRVVPVRVERRTLTLEVPELDDTEAIDVAGGDVVELEVRGELCVTPERCYSADGDQRRVSTLELGRLEYANARRNLEAFRDAPNAALVAVFSDGHAELPLVLGRNARFRAPRPGRLRLLVNDTDARDARGGFVAHVTVNP